MDWNELRQLGYLDLIAGFVDPFAVCLVDLIQFV